MRFRLLRPRELAQRLRSAARLRPDDVEQYLDANLEAWTALATADPHDAADILEEMVPEAAADLIAELDPASAGNVLDEMRAEHGADVVVLLPTEQIGPAIDGMDGDMAADLILHLDDEMLATVLDLVAPETAEAVRPLLAYAPDSAGGLMTADVAALQSGITTGEAIERLRQLHDDIEDLSYVYVVDHARRLVGVVSFRDLVFARPGVGLDETMVQRPIAVRPDTDREEVAELAQRYGLFGLPVVDHDGTLVGMVPHEAVIEAVQAEASEDFAAAVGAGAEETVFTPVMRSVLMRLPWMVVNLAMAVVVALVIERQTSVIDEVGPVLAALMPVVALLGGNAGAQSLAVVIRGMAVDDVTPNRVPMVIGKQVAIGAINAIPIGILATLVGILFGGTTQFGITMGVATVANLTAGTLAGTSIPLILRRMGQDPALASNIFLTLVTDFIGFGGFLLVASLLLR